MVAEVYEDTEMPTDNGADGPWCIVGDDLPALIRQAYELWSFEIEDNALQRTRKVLKAAAENPVRPAPSVVSDDHASQPNQRRSSGSNLPASRHKGPPKVNTRLSSTAPELHDSLQTLTVAAQKVIDCWARGDLAGAVRELDAALPAAKDALAKAAAPARPGSPAIGDDNVSAARRKRSVDPSLSP
jgi:hypothetical protein